MKNAFLIYFFLLFITFSCKNDDSDFGVDIVNEGATSANKAEIDLIAYNYYNDDYIRANDTVLTNAVLGVYDEPIFGKFKAEYITQIRFNKSTKLETVLGTDPQIEEVTLSIFPSYSTTDITILPNDNKSKTITQYKLNNLIGDTSKNLNLKVYSLKTKLDKVTAKYSNAYKNIELESELGSYKIEDRNITGEVTKDESGTITYEIKPSIRINLKKEYFSDLILNKISTFDDTSLLNFFKGLIIKCEDENGYLFRFNPNEIQLKIKYTNKKDDKSRNTLEYYFDLSSSFNVRNGNYSFTRSEELLNKLKNPNKIEGDEKLYLQGMGGASAILKINDSHIEELKKRIEKEKVAIVSAKIKLHVAEESSNLDKPPYIFANKVELSSEGKITNYQLFDDFLAFNRLIGWNFSPVYNSSKNHYELNITQHVQNLIQNKITNNPIAVDVGTFTGTTFNTNINDRAYNPNRLVVYGNNTLNTSKKIKLEIILTKKN